MSIDHFYVMAGYAVWGYILLCIFIKLVLDKRKKKKDQIKKEEIKKFLSTDTSFKSKKNLRKNIMQYAREDELFDYICGVYSKNKDEYTENDKYTYYKIMNQILKRKIKESLGRGRLYRYFLVKKIQQTKIGSETMKEFVSECREESKDRWKF